MLFWAGPGFILEPNAKIAITSAGNYAPMLTTRCGVEVACNVITKTNSKKGWLDVRIAQSSQIF